MYPTGNFPLSANGITSSTELSALFPALVSLVNNSKTLPNAPQNQITPIEEMQQTLTSVPSDVKRAIEEQSEYIEINGQLFQEFIVWLITYTDLGRTFLLGPGNRTSQKLRDKVQELVPTVNAQSSSRIQQLEAALIKQSEELKKFKEQFGVVEEQPEGVSHA